jgi:hypothetical protein
MKELFLVNLVPMICVVGAIAVILTGGTGWGWLLVVAVLLAR